jgi:hypothetical protein
MTATGQGQSTATYHGLPSRSGLAIRKHFLPRLTLFVARRTDRVATQRYWFPAKPAGWGRGFPQTWEGWVVLAAWTPALLWGVHVIRLRRHPIQNPVFIIAMSALMILICYWKGEPLRWRWRNRGAP